MMGLGPGCPSFPNPLALYLQGEWMETVGPGWEKIKGVLLGVRKKGGPCSCSPSTGDPP